MIPLEAIPPPRSIEFSGILLSISALITLCVNGAESQRMLHMESNKSLCVC